MNWLILRRLPKSFYLLLPIMAFAYYIAFIPHRSYLYPVHIDEWVHLAYARAILASGGTAFTDPFLGQSTVGLGSPGLEAGFQLFWGVFYQISGVSWIDIFRYFPGIILVITVLSVYVLAQRQGFGWEAAFFACLVPTTVGILGPGFLVPVSLGLVFLPLALFLAFNFRGVWVYLVLFIFTSFLLTIHAPSAIVVVIVLIPYILLNLKGNFKHSLGITLALLVSFLAPFPWIFALLLPTAKGLFVPQALPSYVDFPRVIKTYGYLPVAICLLGTFLLAIRGSQRNYGLLFGLLALLVMLVTFFTFHYGVSIMYERGLTFMMLLVGVVAGAGLAWVKNLSLPGKFTAWLRTPLISQNVGKFLCLVLIGVTLAVALPDRQNTAYYYMIDGEDYRAFTWIEENLDKAYAKAVLDPWKATAFAAITGRKVYTRIHEYPKSSDEEAYQFLEGGSSNTTFLRENGISIVYSQREVRNPDLVEVRENVYLLK